MPGRTMPASIGRSDSLAKGKQDNHMTTTMPRTAKTLRLSPEAQSALDRIVATTGASANSAIEKAVIEYDTKRVEAREATLRRLYDENRPLMDRLG